MTNKLNGPKDELIEFVRDNKWRKIGVVIACKFGRTVVVSFAQRHDKLDKYNESNGLLIARSRAASFYTNGAGKNPPRLPLDSEPVFHKMLARATRYYKDCKVVPIAHRFAFDNIQPVYAHEYVAVSNE